MTKISVIIPAYNAELTILETIQSIQKQSFQDFEIVVINDGSKDKTLEILESIDDKRLKIFSYENAGLATARNRGISHAKGEFISFLDADDLWTKYKLELQLAALETHPEAGVAYSWVSYMVNREGTIYFAQGFQKFLAGNIYPQLLLENFIGNGSNILVRRKAIESVGLFESEFNSCADWDFYLRLASQWSFVVVPKNQIIYRLSSYSMTSKVNLVEREGLLVIEKAYKTAPTELQYLKKQSLANFYRYCADLLLSSKAEILAIQKAQQKLWYSIQLYPQILCTKLMQKLILKSFLKQVFPLSTNYYRSFKRGFAMRDPRLQQK